MNYTFTNPTGKHQIDLRGKMDRIDLTKEDNKVIGAVVDYKSSAKKFDLGLFANGISLQMVSYLDVLKKNHEFFANDQELDLLGAFYQTITKNVERLNVDTNLNADFNLKDIKANNEKKLMYKGILNNDPALLASIEPLLQEDRASSELYNGVKRKVDGSFSLPSDTSFNAEDLDRILEYNSYLIQQAAHKILNGNIELNPYHGVFYDGANLSGRVVDFSDTGCTITPRNMILNEDGSMEGGVAAPGHESEETNIHITYAEDVVFQIVYFSMGAQTELSREDTDKSSIKKETDVDIFGACQDEKHWVADKVVITRWQ